MIWAHVRFTLDDRGAYADEWVVLSGCSGVHDGAAAAQRLCDGYRIGCGRSAVVVAIDTASKTNQVVLDSGGVRDLYSKLMALRRRA